MNAADSDAEGHRAGEPSRALKSTVKQTEAAPAIHASGPAVSESQSCTARRASVSGSTSTCSQRQSTCPTTSGASNESPHPSPGRGGDVVDPLAAGGVQVDVLLVRRRPQRP